MPFIFALFVERFYHTCRSSGSTPHDLYGIKGGQDDINNSSYAHNKQRYRLSKIQGFLGFYMLLLFSDWA